jgi:hypothetical protein
VKNLIKKILKEEEDNLKWARDIVSIKIGDVKWIRTSNGNRYQENNRHLDSDRYNNWAEFSGWDNWYRVQGLEFHNGKLCFITSLTTNDLKSRYFYYTPLEDYNEKTMSFSEERPYDHIR